MSTVTRIQPRQRTIVGVDIEQSTSRNNVARAELRDDMYNLLEAALGDSELTEDLRDPFLDRGDGAMTFVHPVDEAPRTLLLNTFFPTLSRLLGEHGAGRPNRKFRLRAAMHSGDVHYDRRGPFGEDIDVTARLLDAPELKSKLREVDAPLVLVVSEYIYWSVVRHGYDGIDGRTFEPLINLQVGGRTYRGWVQVPAESRPIGKAIPLIDRVS